MVRVLIVDDSALMRKIASELMSKDVSIKVVGTATNGQEAFDKLDELKPDVILTDIEMPEMDGISFIKKIMKEKPLPIIVFSKYTKKDSIKAMESIKLGAVDFVFKPDVANLHKVQDELIRKIKAASKANINVKFNIKKSFKKSFSSTRKKIIVIASSTGGPQTLESLLVALPKEIPVPILVVQHMPVGFTKTFADRLNSICEIEVKEAKEGDELKPGVALIAPGGYHMELIAEVEGLEGTIKLNQNPPQLGVRPNANVMFKSVVNIFKENTIGVVLTGMGSDGKEGSKTIKENGGTVIAEAEESCVIYGMPKEVIDAGYADEVLLLENIPVSLIQLMDV